MKAFILVLIPLLVASAIPNHCSSQQAPAKQKSKTNVSRFVGKWKGSETCKAASAPVALLFVSQNGSNVLLTGIYSTQGQINASIKGDTIVIAQQEVKDPNFKNLFIEGKLAFGTNPFSLSGKVTLLNNQQKDECLVKYFK
jgi:hypothetical protein